MSITAVRSTLSTKDLREAREWIEDVFEKAPCDLDSGEVENAIARHYVGGVAQFIADGETR
jgi:hypothetical protein